MPNPSKNGLYLLILDQILLYDRKAGEQLCVSFAPVGGEVLNACAFLAVQENGEADSVVTDRRVLRPFRWRREIRHDRAQIVKRQVKSIRSN